MKHECISYWTFKDNVDLSTSHLVMENNDDCDERCLSSEWNLLNAELGIWSNLSRFWEAECKNALINRKCVVLSFESGWCSTCVINTSRAPRGRGSPDDLCLWSMFWSAPGVSAFHWTKMGHNALHTNQSNTRDADVHAYDKPTQLIPKPVLSTNSL